MDSHNHHRSSKRKYQKNNCCAQGSICALMVTVYLRQGCIDPYLRLSAHANITRFILIQTATTAMTGSTSNRGADMRVVAALDRRMKSLGCTIADTTWNSLVEALRKVSSLQNQDTIDEHLCTPLVSIDTSLSEVRKSI